MPEEGKAIKMEQQLDEEQLQDLYAWLDEITLSRAKRNVGRDFSDGVLVAETVNHFIPRMVELHNYTPASSTQHKIANWNTLNRKVLAKLNCQVPDRDIRGVINSKQGSVESFLWKLRHKIDIYLMKRRSMPQKMSPDGYLDGQEVGTLPSKPLKADKLGIGKPPKPAAAGPKAPIVLNPPPQGYSNDPRGASYRQPFNGGMEPDLPPAVRMVIEQKEQALLASQETVQILQAKVRRLEHLLKLKDDRIEELMKSVHKAQGHY